MENLGQKSSKASDILLIGGGGFIGRATARLLLESGCRVKALGRRRDRPPRLDERVNYVCGDFGDEGCLMPLLKPGVTVVHLAYATVPKTSVEDPMFDLLANLPACVRLFDFATRVGVQRLVFVSSGGTVYGPARELPIHERHPTEPISPYGITKLAIERYALMYARTKKLPAVIVRPGNAYGEEQERGTGQGFIANAIGTILERRAVPVYGEGGTVRDFIHVEDVAAGIVAAVERGEDGATYNIGTGRGATINDILEGLGTLAGRLGLEVAVERFPSRPFDVEANVLDSSELTCRTGWSPRVPLAEGLSRVWNSSRRVLAQGADFAQPISFQ